MRHYLTTSHYTKFTPGSPALCPTSYDIEEIASDRAPDVTLRFWLFKTAVDWGCTAVALPLIAALSVLLLLVNPLLNPGPLFFSQERLGKHGRVFRMWKFRTMIAAASEVRDPTAPVESGRITLLGKVLRKFRIDELPNFFNVLGGDMSVVGPRPEAVSHAAYYNGRVAGYSTRLRVKPGITGLAQVEQGYAEDEDATSLKAKYDNMYVECYCGRLDLYIIVKTFAVMARGFGAK